MAGICSQSGETPAGPEAPSGLGRIAIAKLPVGHGECRVCMEEARQVDLERDAQRSTVTSLPISVITSRRAVLPRSRR